MAEQLIIRLHALDHADADTARWLVLDARGNCIGFPQSGPLRDAAPLAEHRRVTVLIPGEDILQLRATVPGRNRQQITRAAPYAIEDRIAGDIDALFVAVLETGSATTPSRFAVIERTLLEQWITRLRAAELKPDSLLPDHVVLPEPEPHAANWWFESDRLLVRDEQQGFAAPAGDAPLLLRHVPEDTQLSITRVGDAPLPDSLPDNVAVTAIDADRAFTELAALATARKDGGLLQQEYRPENRRESALRNWRVPAIAAAVLLVIGTAQWSLEVHRLQRESAFLDEQMQALFNRAMPGSRFDPATAAAQMRIRLRGNDGSGDGRLLAYLAAIGNSLNGLEDAQFTGFSFRDGRLEFTVSVKDARTLEMLQQKLREQTEADIQLRSADSEGDRLEGRIVLEGGAA